MALPGHRQRNFRPRWLASAILAVTVASCVAASSILGATTAHSLLGRGAARLMGPE